MSAVLCVKADSTQRTREPERTQSLAAPAELVDLLRKLFDVGFLHCDRRHKDLFAWWNLRSVAVQNLRHQLHRAVTKLKRLLHDRGVNRTSFDSAQRLIFLVEGNDFHLVEFVRFSDRRQNRWSIVGPETNHACD